VPVWRDNLELAQIPGGTAPRGQEKASRPEKACVFEVDPICLLIGAVGWSVHSAAEGGAG
jgi:hypothetical protein